MPPNKYEQVTSTLFDSYRGKDLAGLTASHILGSLDHWITYRNPTVLGYLLEQFLYTGLTPGQIEGLIEYGIPDELRLLSNIMGNVCFNPGWLDMGAKTGLEALGPAPAFIPDWLDKISSAAFIQLKARYLSLGNEEFVRRLVILGFMDPQKLKPAVAWLMGLIKDGDLNETDHSAQNKHLRRVYGLED